MSDPKKPILIEYLWWWLTPLIVFVLFFALLLYLANATGDSPFVYEIF